MASPDVTLKVNLPGGQDYPVHFAPLAALPRLMHTARLRQGKCLVVTDTHVGPLYGDAVETALSDAGWTPRRLTIDAGEASKTYAPLHAIYDAALAWGIDRKTTVIALGGGVVGDLAGFAAATLLRGLPLVQVPTSCIAQVDSAIGGKTGINHTTGKNLIGAFHQPHLVCADTTTLQTLSEREWMSGLAEVVKHACIADADFASFLATNWDGMAARDPKLLARMLPRAAQIKTVIVSNDIHEHGQRALLNFGHTFGHAIERVAGYGVFTHGEAVAVGMQAALHLSTSVRPEFDITESLALVRRLPTGLGSLADLSRADLFAAMRKDKKMDGQRLRFILLRALGQAYVTAEVEPDAVEAAWIAAGATTA